MAMKKAEIRAAKDTVLHRISELRKMDVEALKAEHLKLYPHAEQPTDIREMFASMLYDFVDRAFPDHRIT